VLAAAKSSLLHLRLAAKDLLIWGRGNVAFLFSNIQRKGHVPIGLRHHFGLLNCLPLREKHTPHTYPILFFIFAQAAAFSRYKFKVEILIQNRYRDEKKGGGVSKESLEAPIKQATPKGAGKKQCLCAHPIIPNKNTHSFYLSQTTVH